MSFSPARAEGQLGSAITVTMQVENANDLFTAPFKINFDPKILHLNDVIAGSLLTSDGKQILPLSKNILNDTGEASVALTRALSSILYRVSATDPLTFAEVAVLLALTATAACFVPAPSC